MPVMAHHFAEIDGKPHRVDDGQVNLGPGAVDVEKKDGSRTLMVPVIRDAGRLPFDRFLDAYDALVEKARTNTLTADDLVGANITLTNPGGLGTVASVPRLMPGQGTIVATGSIAYPVGLGEIGAMIGAEKVMTMTSTYDHRIIQGAESGRFLALIEELPAGRARLLRGRVRGARRRARRRCPPPAPAAPRPRRPRPERAPEPRAPRARSCCRRCRRRARSSRRFRSHGHLAAHLDPLGSSPRATRRSTPRRSG
jgi:2-oxoglutarate decarboxylase